MTMTLFLRIFLPFMASLNFMIYAKTGCPLQLGAAIFNCFMFLWNLSFDMRGGKM